MPRHYHREGEDLQLESRLLARLEKKKDKLDLHRPLSPTIARRLHEDLRIRLTYHSNAIEGNTLTLRETQVVIEEGITIGGHSLREHLEATNHAGNCPKIESSPGTPYVCFGVPVIRLR